MKCLTLLPIIIIVSAILYINQYMHFFLTWPKKISQPFIFLGLYYSITLLLILLHKFSYPFSLHYPANSKLFFSVVAPVDQLWNLELILQKPCTSVHFAVSRTHFSLTTLLFSNNALWQADFFLAPTWFQLSRWTNEALDSSQSERK